MKARFLTQLLRTAVGLAILLYLFRRIDLSGLGSALHASLAHPFWLAGGIGMTFLGLTMGVIRWHRILRAQGLSLTGARVFSIFFVGQFFNAFMPGACGGDVARAYYVVRDTHRGKRTEAASTVFVDRAVGLFVLILFCCGVIAVRLPFFLTHPKAKAVGMLMLAFLAFAVLGILALFRRNLFEHWSLFRRVESWPTVGPLIRRAYDAFYLYRRRLPTVAQAFAFSLLNLGFLTSACICFSSALEIELPHPILNHFTMFPIITTLAAIPLTPGALGLREGLFAGLYGYLGVPPEQAVSLSLLVYAGGLFCSLLGGIIFIRHTASEHHGLREELEALSRERADTADPESIRRTD